jgi:predicted DNA-binding transcriptional regulator AlpA
MSISETTATPRQAPAPLLIGAEEAAALCGICRSSFLAADKTGEIGPQSVRIGGRRLWVYDELVAWTLAGCPARGRWAEIWQRRGDNRPQNVSEAQEVTKTRHPASRKRIYRESRIRGDFSLTSPAPSDKVGTLGKTQHQILRFTIDNSRPGKVHPLGPPGLLWAS